MIPAQDASVVKFDIVSMLIAVQLACLAVVSFPAKFLLRLVGKSSWCPSRQATLFNLALILTIVFVLHPSSSLEIATIVTHALCIIMIGGYVIKSEHEKESAKLENELLRQQLELALSVNLVPVAELPVDERDD